MGISEEELLIIIPFVMKGLSQHWFQSNANKFREYKDFKYYFLKLYQSQGLSYAKLSRLRSMPFDPRIHRSVESFVTERYSQIRELDPNVTE